MNCLPIYRSNRISRRKRGFTLVEMLVSMAVLVMIMIMLGQVLQMASQAWVTGQRKVNNFTKARAMLEMFTRDMQGSVFRSDLAIFPGSQITFYTKRPGIPAGGGDVRNVSLVNYAYSADQSSNVSMSTLQRGDMAIPWNAVPGSISFGNTVDFGANTPSARDTAPGVLNYKVLFVYADGTSSVTYTTDPANPLRAVGLTLAVIDDITLKNLTITQMQTLRTALDANFSGTGSIKADWENYLSTGMNWSSYPKNLGVGLKIFERYVIVAL